MKFLVIMILVNGTPHFAEGFYPMEVKTEVCEERVRMLKKHAPDYFPNKKMIVKCMEYDELEEYIKKLSESVPA